LSPTGVRCDDDDDDDDDEDDDDDDNHYKLPNVTELSLYIRRRLFLGEYDKCEFSHSL